MPPITLHYIKVFKPAYRKLLGTTMPLWRNVCRVRLSKQVQDLMAEADSEGARVMWPGTRETSRPWDQQQQMTGPHQ